jgi:hypothetical protein
LQPLRGRSAAPGLNLDETQFAASRHGDGRIADLLGEVQRLVEHRCCFAIAPANRMHQRITQCQERPRMQRRIGY